MRQIQVLLAVAVTVALLSAASCSTICAPGETQECQCPGGTTSAQVCDGAGTRWQSCPCAPGSEDPHDDDDGADDDDTTPPPDDDDTTPPPDDDDSVSPDDDDSVQCDDDDDSQLQCGDLVMCAGDPSVCEDPAICAFDLGCICVELDGIELCMPLCSTQDDCPWKDDEQMLCMPEGHCAP